MDKKHILIVDDEPDTCEILAEFLRREGYDVSFAASGPEALSQVEKVVPDTVLLDVMMPGMDGFEVCQRLKADDRWRHIPVILVTALHSKADMVQGFNVGADDFLRKPVNSLELRGRVRSMLRIKKQYDELKAQNQNLEKMLKLRDELANLIVNDARNSLTAIMGFNELLILGNLVDPAWMGETETVRKEIYRLNSLFTDMLMLVKTEQDKVILNYSTTNINKLVENCEAAYKSVADSKDIKLKVSLPKNPCLVSLDANLFQQVLNNLVSNALKFSPPSSEVSLQVERPQQKSDFVRRTPQVRIRVLDQGFNVPEAQGKTVFEKVSVSSLNEEGEPQVGLGLAFCKIIVEAHDGHIFVMPNRPKGSIFVIEV